MGLYSKSKDITIICLDLLSDIYLQNKLKNFDCKQEIEHFKKSENRDVSVYAKELLTDLETVPKKKFSFIPLYSFLIFIAGLLLTIETIDFYNSTFIKLESVITIFIIGVIFAGSIHIVIIKNKNIKKTNLIEIIIGYGLLFCFLLLYLNFSFPKSESRLEIFKIEKKDTLAKGTHSKCRKPYIEFVRKGNTKRIVFDCSKQEIVEESNFISIETKKGLFNFEILVVMR